MKTVINSTLLSNIKLAEKQYDIWDAKLTGFILRVHPNGNLVYRCEFARGKRMTIGNAKILTPMQARDRAKEILADAIRGINPQDKKQKHKILTLAEFIKEEYAPWLMSNTKTGKKLMANNLLPFIKIHGEKLLAEINSWYVEKWRTQRIEQGAKAATVNKNIGILKAALSKAVEWGFLDKNPLEKLKSLKVDVIAKIRFLTEDEHIKLKQALNDREEKIRQARDQANQWREERGCELFPNLREQHFVDYLKPMVVMARNTGIRKNELLSIMKEKDINLNLKILSISDKNAKSGKARHIPLNDEAFITTKKWIEQTGPAGLLFSNIDGQKISDIRKSWANLLKGAGIQDLRWHDLRHDFASRLVMAGVELNTVRELLGHSDIKMTLRYAHLAPEHKAEAVGKLIKS